jgi:hypothetical protein
MLVSLSISGNSFIAEVFSLKTSSYYKHRWFLGSFSHFSFPFIFVQFNH